MNWFSFKARHAFKNEKLGTSSVKEVLLTVRTEDILWFCEHPSEEGHSVIFTKNSPIEALESYQDILKRLQ